MSFAQPNTFPQKTILVIDDDASLHDLSRVVLTRIGFRYVSAFSGMEGLKRIKEHHPHMILLDLMMPDIDGEMLYKELITNPEYEEFRSIPVIMLTALTHDDERKSRLLEMGISAYLNKPFGLNELVNVIQSVFVTHEIKMRNVKLHEEITNTNSYLERLINYAPVGILSTDKKGVIVRVNSFFVQMMAAPDASMFIGKNILDCNLLHQEEICTKFKQVLETGDSIKIPTLNLKNAQGWAIRANVNCVALRDDNNVISGLLSIWEDVTQIEKQTYELTILRQVGQALQRTLDLRELMHLILTSITAGCALGFSRAMIFLIDNDKNVLEGRVGVGPMSGEEARDVWNELSKDNVNLEAFLEKYGTNIPQEESPFGKLVQKVRISLSEENNILVKAIKEKKAFKVDRAWENSFIPEEFKQIFQVESFVAVPLIAKNRAIGVIMADNKYSEFPIEDDRVELLMLFANQAALAIENAEAYKALEDKIAQLNEAFQQLQEAQDKLLRSERLAVIGKMAAHVAHEIRNPLTAIGGFSRRIIEHSDDPKIVKQGAEIIFNEVNRLEKILANVLNFTKVSKPFRKLHNINRLLDSVIQLHDPLFKDHKIVLERNYSSDLSYVYLDEDQMRQVFNNIFTNCIYSMPDGGKITISTSSDEESAIIAIQDTGIGMPEEVLENMFNPFYTNRQGGTGLGMAVTQKIIQEHDGKIEVHSEVGKGTLFRIYLPLKIKETTLTSMKNANSE